MTRILLVENLPTFHSMFAEVADVELDIARNLTELRRLLRLNLTGCETPVSWDYALVDFDYVSDLSAIGAAERETGLTALALLREQSPRTKCIAFTSFHENGRLLYAAAAHRWFGAWAMLDKGRADLPVLRALVNYGTNPTTSQWLTKLTRHSHIIDDLFAGRHWAYLWTRWNTYGATDRRVHQGVKSEPDAPYFTLNDVRVFKEAMMHAVPRFNEHFQPLRPMLGVDKPQSLITAFYEANSLFLSAVDIHTALASRPKQV